MANNKQEILNRAKDRYICALQELQQEFNIPDDNEHLENAFKFTEDLREKYLKEQD